MQIKTFLEGQLNRFEELILRSTRFFYKQLYFLRQHRVVHGRMNFQPESCLLNPLSAFTCLTFVEFL